MRLSSIIAKSASRPEVSVAICLALFHAALMSRLWVGDFFNSYHYISDDGFDWITQGVAFNQLITGQDGASWPVLRQPVFVMVAALDNVMGNYGFAFLIVQAAAVGGTAYLIGAFARRQNLATWSIVTVMLAWYFFIFGFYRLWVLSDTLAAAFMTASVVMVINRLDNLDDGAVPAALFKRFVPAVLVTVLAGLTQTYGLIPFLVVCGIYTLGALLGRRSVVAIATPVALVLAASAGVFGGQALWVAVIPHDSVPTQFGMLQLSGAMSEFYFNVWLLVYAPLLPVVVLAGYRKFQTRTWPSLRELALISAVAAFAVLSFIYQWAESRMTFMYFPVVCLGIIAWCSRPDSIGQRRESWSLVASAVATILIGLSVVPGDFWRPNISQARLDPRGSWLANALRDEPQDRYFLQTMCSGMGDVCSKAVFEAQSSPYRTMMFDEYRRRMSGQSRAVQTPAN
jgi:hypothetical protein